MSGHYLELLIIGFIYGTLMCFIIVNYWRRKRGSNNDDDDDGGITVPKNPILDLPPGVCLPSGPRVKIKEDLPDEVPA